MYKIRFHIWEYPNEDEFPSGYKEVELDFLPRMADTIELVNNNRVCQYTVADVSHTIYVEEGDSYHEFELHRMDTF